MADPTKASDSKQLEEAHSAYLSELRRDFLASVGITVGPSSFLQNHV